MSEGERCKAFEPAGWSARAATFETLVARATVQAIDRLLGAAGVVAGVVLDEISFALAAAGFDELWEGVLGGPIRTAGRLVAGGEGARDALREIAEPYRDGDGYALPTMVRIASGRCP